MRILGQVEIALDNSDHCLVTVRRQTDVPHARRVPPAYQCQRLTGAGRLHGYQRRRLTGAENLAGKVAPQHETRFQMTAG